MLTLAGQCRVYATSIIYIVCVYVCMCVWGGGGGNLVVNLPVVFPGYWAMALLIPQRETDGLASRTVLFISFEYSQKRKILKPRHRTFHMLSQRPELHAGMSVLSEPLVTRVHNYLLPLRP